MLVRHRHQFSVELLDDEAYQEVGGGVFLRHDDEKGLLAGTKLLGVDGAVEAEDLLQLTIQKCVEPWLMAWRGPTAWPVPPS